MGTLLGRSFILFCALQAEEIDMSDTASLHLNSFGDDLRAIIIGASGGIGDALCHELSLCQQVTEIYALSRTQSIKKHAKTRTLSFDLTDENTIKSCADTLKQIGQFDIIIIATGLLHGAGISPEKNMNSLSIEGLTQSYRINAIGPAITAKYFLPLLRHDKKTIFAALSARVSSISDNGLGGWYGYRASKAALNMLLKTLSIEFGRRHTQAIICGLHPGTVDTPLSAPFQANVPEGKLFTPAFSARRILTVIEGLTPKDSGSLLAWDGQRIPF